MAVTVAAVVSVHVEGLVVLAMAVQVGSVVLATAVFDLGMVADLAAAQATVVDSDKASEADLVCWVHFSEELVPSDHQLL
ncbi:hypothetical protein Q1695_003833 [Nippostrongylus brasiliensis]|nr:hypothetical protein Q1695_003833 [Nippostrongylus brasiliensis]